jgi:tRNA(Ile)-lysidine synthase TilS/MesJ
MTNPGMKCTRCRGPAVHRFPQHNARFCDACLEIFFRRQVEKAIEDYAMLVPGQRVLVAVSGGKDSLALWQVLCDLGYEAEGVHLGLDLEEFSPPSLASCQEMADRLARPLHLYNLRDMTGFSVQEVAWANRREFCAVCGTLKRHYLNRVCSELGAPTLATGHHLDDETGRLLGNLIHRHQRHLERQWPALPAVPPGLAAKVKPLCRLGAEEIRAYAQAHHLPVAEGSCPRSKGATLPYYQEAMRFLEEKMPGTKRDFYLGFLRAKPGPPISEPAACVCQACGNPSHIPVCSVCRLLAKARLREEARAAEAAQASTSD